jgi:hypothetical protein
MNPRLCVLAHEFQKAGTVSFGPTSCTKVTMHAEHNMKPTNDPTLDRLAHESQVPINDVTRIYCEELAKLEVGAHLTSFLPIFAIRKVRKILLQRSIVRLAPAYTGR